MNVSVVVCSLLKEKNKLRNLLNSLRSQKVKPKEIILVVPKNVKIPEWVRRYKVKIRRQNGDTLADARNVGILASKSSIVAFTDDDCIVPRDWIEKILKAFKENKGIAGVCGKSLPVESRGFFGGIGGAWKNIKRKTYVLWAGGRNMAFLRNVLLDVGLFDPNMITNDDVEIGLKLNNAGFKILFDPNLYVYHDERTKLRDIVKQRFRYGIGKAQLLKRKNKLKPPLSIYISPLLCSLFLVLVILSVIFQSILLSVISLLLLLLLTVPGLKTHYFKPSKIFNAFVYVLISRFMQFFGFLYGLIRIRKLK